MLTSFLSVLEVESLRQIGLIFLLIVCGCSRSSILNNEGVLYYYFEDTDSAKESFLKSLVLDPESTYVRYNLSLVDISEERIAAAEKELAYLEKKIWAKPNYNKKGQELFKVMFARAFLKGAIKDIPGALKKYQEALELNPDSKAVKKNIELLLSGQSSESGSPGDKGKSEKKSDKGDKNKEQKKDGDSQDKDKDGQDETDEDKEVKGQDDETLKRKNLSPKEVEQILKEIKSQESRIRSQENSNYKGEGANGKTW